MATVRREVNNSLDVFPIPEPLIPAGQIGPRPILSVGVVLMIAGFLLLLRPTLDEGYWTAWFPAIMTYGLGIACMVVPLTTMGLAALPQRNSGIASGVNNAASRIGQMLSIAIFGALIVAQFQTSLGDMVRFSCLQKLKYLLK